ncbi:MAG: tetratricopeptide repeat protein [Firmicutes bacterium]|nr:tetratricopeptide repeat protein [Bacillota bacterium]
MAQRELTVENMTKEEHKKLDNKANIALFVVVIMFGFSVFFLNSLYKRILISQRANSVVPGSENQNRLPQGTSGPSGINQPELDKMIAEGKFTDAMSKIETALTTAPDDFNANLAMGLLYQKQGAFTKARRYLEKAARLNSSDTYCSQVLGQFYIVADPAKAAEYFKGLSSVKTYAVDFTIDEYRSLIRAAFMAKSKSAGEQHLKAAQNLEKKINSGSASKNYSYILCQAEKAFLEGNYKKSEELLAELPSDSSNNLTFTDKYASMILLGLLQANSGETAKAAESFSQCSKMMDNWQEPVFDRYLPRDEQNLLFKRILLGQNPDTAILKKNTEKLKQLDGTGIIPPDGSQEIRSLFGEMLEAEKKGNYNKAIKSALELKKTLEEYITFYADEDISIPVFRNCLDIYIGDLYKTTENKAKADEFYTQASKGYEAVRKIAEERKAKL